MRAQLRPATSTTTTIQGCFPSGLPLPIRCAKENGNPIKVGPGRKGAEHGRSETNTRAGVLMNTIASLMQGVAWAPRLTLEPDCFAATLARNFVGGSSASKFIRLGASRPHTAVKPDNAKGPFDLHPIRQVTRACGHAPSPSPPALHPHARG